MINYLPDDNVAARTSHEQTDRRSDVHRSPRDEEEFGGAMSLGGGEYCVPIVFPSPPPFAIKPHEKLAKNA